LGEKVNRLKPEGGSFCIQTERPDSPNHNDRIRGIMDGLIKDSDDAVKWHNAFGCPIEHYGDFDRAIKQMVRTLTTFKVDTFISTGGGPQFMPKLYRSAISPYQAAIRAGEIIIASIDTIPVQLAYLSEGTSTINVGQRPYQMGKWTATMLKMLTDDEVVPMVINTGLTYCTKENANNCTH